MNSINNRQNSVNFTARMNLEGLSNGAKRMQGIRGISEMFEARTEKYPDDIFEICDLGQNGVQIHHYDKGVVHEHCANISLDSWDKLFQKSDEVITKKLVKLFNIFKKEDKEVTRASKYVDSVMKRDKNNDPTDFEGKFWDIVVDKITADTKIAIDKDSVLREFKVY